MQKEVATSRGDFVRPATSWLPHIRRKSAEVLPRLCIQAPALRSVLSLSTTHGLFYVRSLDISESVSKF